MIQVRHAGFTLAELMLVMVLVGVLLGIGMAGVDQVDPGARGLQSSVESFVQSARDRARSSGQPVVMKLLQDETGKPAHLVRYVFRRSIEANFEPAYSDRQQVQIVAPAALGNAGRYGAGLNLAQGGGATVVGRGGQFRSPSGLQIEFDFRADELEGSKLMRWEDLGEIELQRNGSLKWTAVYGDGVSWANQELSSQGGAVRKGRWHHLRAIAIDGRMMLILDGEILAQRDIAGELATTSNQPYLGDLEGRFTGAIDEFVVWGRVIDEGPSLSAEQEMLLGSLEVVFDRFGRLDPSVHEEPVPVRISARGIETGAFRIGIFTEEVLP
ncbi:MAG: LamG domain-containing protein [Planctomycetes bacterium]|nr:LamG domain-containing protein [Planctomycetota bacterium]